ncbi:long-chain fatty acid--CoA ligase [Pseudonocardiaceae bacterium YIM PH 21723]|nr:long-chain fatty acid--CoA ligase [Pseudonocardiaceae bacterium YIM PH 21723]
MGIAEDCLAVADQNTVPRLVLRNAEQYGDHPALTDTAGSTLTWAEVRERSIRLAAGLSTLGLGAGDRMLIMMANRPEHWLIDLAAMHLGAISSTVYATLTSDQVGFLGEHSKAKVIVLEGADQVQRWLPVLDRLPELRRIVVLDESAVPAGDDRFLPWSELATLSADLDAVEGAWQQVKPSDPITLIYTSGTTGDPKGVLISHHNVVLQSAVAARTAKTDKFGKTVSYLPLAHIAERILGMYLPYYLVAHVHPAPDPSKILQALTTVRPRSFFGVPRVWEKLVAGIQAQLAAAPEKRQKLFYSAHRTGVRIGRLRQAGESVPLGLRAKHAIADKVVLSKVRERLGLDQLTYAGSGAAPITVDTLEFLSGLGITILEVWGLTETVGSATANSDERIRYGTVGHPQPTMEVRIAEDGEILTRGPLVALGYLRADGGVDSMVDADGWFATGDIGEFDADGFLRITDRKKELIITAGGKNIAPTKIEGMLRTHPAIGNAAVIGDRRPFLTAVISLEEGVADDADTRAQVEQAVAAANTQLPKVEQIKRYHVVAQPWTPDSGEVTPTLKLRRRVINDVYAAEIENLYTQ